MLCSIAKVNIIERTAWATIQPVDFVWPTGTVGTSVVLSEEDSSREDLALQATLSQASCKYTQMMFGGMQIQGLDQHAVYASKARERDRWLDCLHSREPWSMQTGAFKEPMSSGAKREPANNEGSLA